MCFNSDELDRFDSLNVGNGFFEDIRELFVECLFLFYVVYNWYEYFILGGIGVLMIFLSM